jgi:hypothetical protein
VDIKGGAGSDINHEVQSGSTYDVSIDFAKIPISVTEVNSVIVYTGSGGSIKFDNVPVR